VIRSTLTAGLIGGAVIFSAAADYPAPVKKEPDWVISLNARRALWNDPVLSEMNLGVRVRDGEAFVWGPVPTEDMAAEAMARIRLVAGVRSVVSELYVLPADDLLRRKLLPNRPIVKAPQQRDAMPTAQTGHPDAVRPLPSSVVDLVDEVRNRQVRFRGLQVEVGGGIVVVTASRSRAADAMDFADAVRQLPGVTNVIIRSGP
jgi:hypothetical protein